MCKHIVDNVYELERFQSAKVPFKVTQSRRDLWCQKTGVPELAQSFHIFISPE